MSQSLLISTTTITTFCTMSYPRTNMRSIPKLLLLVLVWLVFTFDDVFAFTIPTGRHVLTTNNRILHESSTGVLSNTVVVSSRQSTAHRLAKTPQKEPPKESPKGLDLILLYMTPWRNPNSIFVYLFAIIYVLGKISESRHMTGN